MSNLMNVTLANTVTASKVRVGLTIGNVKDVTAWVPNNEGTGYRPVITTEEKAAMAAGDLEVSYHSFYAMDLETQELIRVAIYPTCKISEDADFTSILRVEATQADKAWEVRDNRNPHVGQGVYQSYFADSIGKFEE